MLNLQEFCTKFSILQREDQQDAIDLLLGMHEINEDFLDALVEIVENKPLVVKKFDLSGKSFPDWG